jgi:hypothetical protein
MEPALALNSEQEAAVEHAIAMSLPTEPNTRRRRLHHLAYELQILPWFADADPRTLKPIVRWWHSLALPNLNHKRFSKSWTLFLRAWYEWNGEPNMERRREKRRASRKALRERRAQQKAEAPNATI